MNKKIKLILFLIFIAIIINTNIVSAKSTNITASTNTTVNSGEEITVTISSSVSLSGYTVSVTNLDGCSFKSVSAPSGVNANSNGSTIGGTLSSGGTQTLAVYKFNAPNVTADKKVTISFRASGLLSADDEEIDSNTTTATITVKAPAQQRPDTGTSETPKELEFTPVNNKKVYLTKATRFRSAYNTKDDSIIETLKAGTELTQIGVSKTKAENYIWSKVKYNGKTGYVINDNLTTTRPAEETPKVETPVTGEPQAEEPTQVSVEEPQEEIEATTNGLKSLEVAGLTLTPAFNPGIYEYRVIVQEDVDNLDISAVSALEGAKISIAGNENLKEGENLITITVYNSDNQVVTYQLTTYKNTLDLTKTDELLKSGNKSARWGLLIFIAILATSIIALIVVLILKHRNENEEYDEEDGDYDFGMYPNILEHTNENKNYTNEVEEEPIQKGIMQEDFMQNDITNEDMDQDDSETDSDKNKRDKRKGKHF